MTDWGPRIKQHGFCPQHGGSASSGPQPSHRPAPSQGWTGWPWGGRPGTGSSPASRPPPAPHWQELIRKGIPHHFRAIVWQLLCSATDMPVKNQYSELLKMSSPCEKLIRRDIARTYPEHEFFKGQDSLGQEVLFNVMKVRPGAGGSPPPRPRPVRARRPGGPLR